MVTIDTNIAFYALAQDGEKAVRAKSALALARFLSVQVLNEFANAARRKLNRTWSEIAGDLAILRSAIPDIRPIDETAHVDGLHIADRYQLSFYDAVLVAVALANDATTLYSEDMQHGLVIDDRLTILNPFLQPEAP